jgi:hypothetical protein
MLAMTPLNRLEGKSVIVTGGGIPSMFAMDSGSPLPWQRLIIVTAV